MDRAQILVQLSAIMQEVLDDPSVELTSATTADDVDGWDSLSNITFFVEVERRFGIKFKTAEIEEIHNVGDMVDMIVGKQAA